MFLNDAVTGRTWRGKQARVAETEEAALVDRRARHSGKQG
jgi:hypothetical protein